jgi:uncharacterized protein (DUF1015 family)
MVEVRPFRGIRYNPRRIQDLSLVTCPPYDVIDPTEQDFYHSLHPWNAIRLDLGKSSKEDSEGENRYSRAARLLDEWLREGILVEEREAGYYLLEEQFQEGEGTLVVRRGLIALLRLDEGSGQRGVRLHEATHPGPKEDRLALMKATAANLSQIFVLYQDSSGVLREILETPPLNGACGEALGRDGVRRRLFFLGDPGTHRRIESFFSERDLFIADGHHRYETALAYRAWRRGLEPGASGPRPWDYVLVYLTGSEDPGLRVYPTHRILWGYPLWEAQSFFSRAERFFDIQAIPWPTPGDVGRDGRAMAEQTRQVGDDGRPRIRCFLPGRREGWQFFLRTGAASSSELFPADTHPLLRSLDVAVLHEVLLGRVLGMSRQDQETGGYLRYVKGEEAALETLEAGPEAQVAFLLDPPPIRSIMELASQGIRMPQKTTFFYPKLLTGLVFRRISAAGERAG